MANSPVASCWPRLNTICVVAVDMLTAIPRPDCVARCFCHMAQKSFFPVKMANAQLADLSLANACAVLAWEVQICEPRIVKVKYDWNGKTIVYDKPLGHQFGTI